MAKRKRLTPPVPGEVPDAPIAAKPATGGNPMAMPPAPARAPISDMAGAAAATAALSEVSAALEAARSEGRLVQSLPLDAIDAGHLVRDRLTSAIAEDEMQTLMTSLRQRGQQTPIEVMETEPGRYGLISGWRRLSALRRLQTETGEAQFGTVLALVRRPETAAEAYVAMVEENEIRVGLSYFERAQIVLRAVQEKVYTTEKQALNGLFGSASRAKRSKIKSFLPLVQDLGGRLNFPTAIGERLGLKLSARLAEKGFPAWAAYALSQADRPTSDAELSVLAEIAGSGPDARPRPRQDKQPLAGEEMSPGVWLSLDADGLHILGPGVTAEVEDRVRAALKP